MAFQIFKKKMDSVDSESSMPPVAINYTDSGIEFPHSTQPQTENEFYWQSLEQEGLADIVDGQYVLPWDEFYILQADEDHKACLALWDIPTITTLRPIIRSEGALSDPDFQIILEGWQDQVGTKQTSAIKRTGAILKSNGQAQLLPKQAWELVERIKEFSRIASNKTENDNKQYWAKIRRLAQQSDTRMDDFLRRTIVLAPETLKLEMRRNQQFQETLIEVQPSFENAPNSWLDTFDRYTEVQPSYNLPLEDGGMVHVLISPEVKTVLNEIKQMPHRRITGERAQAFLNNPYAQLGDDAAKVIPPETFEKAKEDAEIYSYDLTITTTYDEKNLFNHAELRLDGRSQQESKPIHLELNNTHQASIFIETYTRSKSESTNSLYWAGYEIVLSPLTQKQIEQLKTDLDLLLESVNRQKIDQILNLDNYSNRVVDIGVAPVLNSQFMQRDSGEADWLPDHIADLFPSFKEYESPELLSNIQSKIDEAEALDQSEVQLPYLDKPVSIEDAKEIAQQLAKNLQSKSSPESEQTTQASPAQKQERSVLIIDSNIEEIDFTSQRANQLEFNEDIHKPILPNSLRTDVVLKDHQKTGVAWLQNLHKFAPDQISGCLLADDMGLGKTLQLLCFIGTYLETTPNKRPILIVAPVSLLENWEAEAVRFFNGKFGSILKLYGENLKNRKLKKHQIPSELTVKGISNLLREGWRDQHDIVLTTYETLRDLQFSIAPEHWAIMICDEAQKIKVPSALVTRAAIAVKADFKIACTGTPVENSLTDLWCLFDFIQAGLLGSLNEFGRNYRRPIEQITGADATVLEELRRLIQPQILRRTKQEVAKDLPAKIESTDCKQLPISKLQQRLYAQIRQEYRHVSDDQHGKTILGALHKLRMVCAHPFYLEPIAHRNESPKIAWLIDTLKKIQAKQEKVIIFTEFREIQSFLQKNLMEVFGFNVTTVNGDTSASSEKGGASRQGLINIFQRTDGFNIIILSTTAVGFGVNVQAANHVIHYTRCWNPAKEDQATDRAYRIGQTRDVSVYYPTIHSSDFDTFEIKLDRLLGSKRQLAGDMLNGSGEISAKELYEVNLD